MSYLVRLEAWVSVHRELLEQYGRLTFRPGRPTGEKPVSHLLVVPTTEEDVELLLWESGEAEFNHGPFLASVFEHLDLESPEELDQLLDRFLDAVLRDS